ncbi:FAD-dependent oxidoreductase [Actinomadura sp. NPDC048394]|uniref:FAD-dependent oxidoreductase n=1 Tax=Actinomadura sp. NPDC048394 TaxID=3158223 RepID=UPI0033E4C892
MAEPEVLVVGAGPVGLTVAYELARRGIAIRVVDKAEGPATSSRALATHARTLEILFQMGLVDRLLPLGQKVEHFSIHQRGRCLLAFDTNYTKMPTRFPFSLMVDQVRTEGMLREALSEQGVEIEWGVALDRFDADEDGVLAELRHADGGTEKVAVPWLVGTDGGKSTVRKALDLKLLGDTTETWLNADVVITGSDLPRDSNHLLHTGGGSLLLVPFPDPGKWRVVDTLDIEGADDPEVIRARLEHKISRALRRRVKVADPTWISVFTVQQRMIQRMRVGRCFVAGDAAHVHSPASGQGMNTGIQDGYNLAWKLADVVRGHAGDALLDTYGAERVPIGEVLLGSTEKATALVKLRNAALPVVLPVGLGLLNALKPVKRKVEGKVIRGFCGLPLNYADSPLTTCDPGYEKAGIKPGHRVACDGASERASAGWRAMCTELTDRRWSLLGFAGDGSPADLGAMLGRVQERHGEAVSVRTVVREGGDGTGPGPMADPGGRLAAGLGLRPGDYALVRPDGYLAAKGRIVSAEQLLSVLADAHLIPSLEPAETRSQSGE